MYINKLNISRRPRNAADGCLSKVEKSKNLSVILQNRERQVYHDRADYRFQRDLVPETFIEAG